MTKITTFLDLERKNPYLDKTMKNQINFADIKKKG